jgi:Autotransporter beta-domain
MVDFDATHISLDNVNERGEGGASLNVRGNDETVLSATPALELGTQFEMASGISVRPYGEAAPPSSTTPTSSCWRASKARLLTTAL